MASIEKELNEDKMQKNAERYFKRKSLSKIHLFPDCIPVAGIVWYGVANMFGKKEEAKQVRRGLTFLMSYNLALSAYATYQFIN